MDELILECCSEEAKLEQEPLFKDMCTEDDIKKIVSLREAIECNIQDNVKSKANFLAYISLELKIVRKIQCECMERFRDEEVQRQEIELNYLKMRIVIHINQVLQLVLRTFPFDLSLWFDYIHFCNEHNMDSAVDPFLDEMLQLQGSSTADMYQLPVECEKNNCMSFEKARKYLLEGINLHKDNKQLLELAFYFELENAARLRGQREAEACKEKELLIDQRNPDFTAKNAKRIYICFILKLKDVELMNKLMTICANYDFAKGLKTRIFSDLMNFEYYNERIYEIIAIKELGPYPKKKLTKLKIRKCVERFEEGVKQLNTHLMWSFYIETLMKLHQDTTVLPKYILSRLVTAFLKAAKEKKVTKEQCITLATNLKKPNNQAKLVKVLQEATKQYPHSSVLWKKLVYTNLRKLKVKKAYQAYCQGRKALGKDFIPLWKLMFKFEQIRAKPKG